MAYAEHKDSFAGGSECRLFLFETKDGAFKWGYTTNHDPVEFEGVTYEPEAISVTNFKKEASGDESPVTISIPFDHAIALMHVPYLPIQPIRVRVMSYQRNDATLEVKQGFTGLVAGFAQKGAIAELACVPHKIGNVLWMTQKSGCVLATYSGRCGVDMEAFGMDVGAITSFAGTTIQAASFATKPNKWFRGGILKNVANGEVRFITEHEGDAVKVVYPFTDMANDLVLRAYAGDDHTAATCHTKFNNKVNYLGWDHAPTYNVFADGTGKGSNNRGGSGGSGGSGNGDGFLISDILADITDLSDYEGN